MAITRNLWFKILLVKRRWKNISTPWTQPQTDRTRIYFKYITEFLEKIFVVLYNNVYRCLIPQGGNQNCPLTMRMLNNSLAPQIGLANILCRFFWDWWESKEELLTFTSYYSSPLEFLVSGYWTVQMNMNLSWFNIQRNKDSVFFCL